MGLIAFVLCIIVINPGRSLYFYHRKSFVVENTNSQFPAFNALFNKNFFTVTTRMFYRIYYFYIFFNYIYPNTGTITYWLGYHRQFQTFYTIGNFRHALYRRGCEVIRSWNIVSPEDVLRLHFVHCKFTGSSSGTGIWNTFGFKNFLYTTIFSEISVKGNKCYINFIIIKFINHIIINNYLDNIFIIHRQSIYNRFTRLQRYLPFRRYSAH